jgi:amino acid permease
MDIKSTTAVDSHSDNEKVPTYDVAEDDIGLVTENVDDLKRRLSGRQIQMITIGGSIGTALFVSIGSGLVQGGPGSLFIAFILYCFFLAAVNNCMAEMAVFMPVRYVIFLFARFGIHVYILESPEIFEKDCGTCEYPTMYLEHGMLIGNLQWLFYTHGK